MKIITAKKGWLSDSDLRLDASYHLSDGQLTKIAFKKANIKTESLSTVTERIFYGERSKRVYVDNLKCGLPFIKGADINKADFSTLKFISRKRTANLNKYFLEEGWTLITRSGTIGSTAYVNKDFIGKAASDDIIRVVPQNIPSGFLYAFLSSKNGKALLTYGSYGAVVQHIEPEHIENIPIPIFTTEKQLQIHKLITQSADLRVEANNLLEVAEVTFENENNLIYLPVLLARSENVKNYGIKVNYSNKLKKTFKARNYSERAESLGLIWQSVVGKPLHDWVAEDGLTRGMGGFFKRIDNENVKGVDIISQSDIHDIKPKFKQVVKRDTKESEIARKGMIIMPAAGTLGENEVFLRPELVYLNFEGKILSEVIGKLRCKSLEEAAYLFIALRTKAGFRILRAMVYGTNLLYPRWDLIKDLNIPCKNEQTFNKVSELVIDAYEKKAIANSLESQALQLIEKEIKQWQQ